MRRKAIVLVLGLLALVVGAAPSAAGGGCLPPEHTSYARSDHDVMVDIKGCEFTPTVLFVEPGTSVTWKNYDIFPHSVTGQGLTLNSDSMLEKGDEFEAHFTDAGVYPYECAFHPGMTAAVVVGDVGATKDDAEVLTAGLNLPVSGSSSSMPGWPLALIGLFIAVAAFATGRRFANRPR